MSVIKSNAYGHGMNEVGQICDAHPDVSRLCVAGLDEARELSQIGLKKPIQILSFYDLDFESISELVSTNEIVFVVYSSEQVKFLSRVGERVGKEIKVHLKIDTGTTRVGVLPEQALGMALKVARMPFLDLEGVWTHFASSEEDKDFTLKQLGSLKSVITEFREHRIPVRFNHSACTASTILYPETHLNAVRVGLGVYGLHPNKETKKKIDLKMIISLNTKVVQLKSVPKNTSISYARTYTTNKNSLIAVLPIGYYDGYDRKLSNQGEVLIHGVRCKVRGRVCMNLMMVDVTRLKNKIKVGDEAILLGEQENEIITADELADKIETISYEVVCGLGRNLPKIII
jgi:alanine racemase